MFSYVNWDWYCVCILKFLILKYYVDKIIIILVENIYLWESKLSYIDIEN